MATSPGVNEVVNGLLEIYDTNLEKLELFRKQLYAALTNSTELEPHIHSMKSRIKERSHLEEKLLRKIAKAEQDGTAFEITKDNLLTTITDLAGVRVLHLYTRQIKEIDTVLRGIFDEGQYALLQGPFARTWDDESREFFESCGIDTQPSASMYTSVHYVIGSASRTELTCEIQVRTLMEEVWGEVDHAINYPVATDILASREQLKVLARVTSSATRLVDSIFLTHGDQAG